MTGRITKGRPTRSGELRASDDMHDHRSGEIAEESSGANRMKTPAQLEGLRRTVEHLRQDVVEAAAALAQAGPDHETYLKNQLQVARGRARRYERLFNVNLSVTEEEMELADIFHGRDEGLSERERLEGLRVFQLRNDLRERGLDQEGTATEMVERLLAVHTASAAVLEDGPPSAPAQQPQQPQLTSARSSLRTSMELVRYSGGEGIDPSLLATRTASPTRNDEGKLEFPEGVSPAVAEHHMLIRAEIIKQELKVNRLYSAVELNNHPELRVSLDSSTEKLEALKARQRNRFSPRVDVKARQVKGPEQVVFGCSGDRFGSFGSHQQHTNHTVESHSPRHPAGRARSASPRSLHNSASRSTDELKQFSTQIPHKHRDKSPAPGSLSPRGFGTQSPTYRGQHAFGVPWGTSAGNRPSMVGHADMVVKTASGDYRLSAVVGAGGTGQLAPVGLGWRQYYRLLTDKSYIPGARPDRVSDIPEDHEHHRPTKGTLYKENERTTNAKRGSQMQLWRLQDGAMAGSAANSRGQRKVQTGTVFAKHDHFDLTMTCGCANTTPSGKTASGHHTVAKMPCAPGCCQVAGVGVRERVGMLMRSNGEPRKPPVYFAQYTLLRRKTETIPVRSSRNGRRSTSPIMGVPMSGHIPMPPSSGVPKEEKAYVYDEDDFEEETEDQRATLFHLAAESHSSGMRSSKRETLVDEQKIPGGGTLKGVFPAKDGPQRPPRCADMQHQPAGSRWKPRGSEAPVDGGLPHSFQDFLDPFYPQDVQGDPASAPNDMKVARTWYQFTRPGESGSGDGGDLAVSGVGDESGGNESGTDGGSPTGSPSSDGPNKENTDENVPQQNRRPWRGPGQSDQTVAAGWDTSNCVPREAFKPGMFRCACDPKFDEIRTLMWSQTFAIGSDDMADLFDMYDQNGSGELEREEFRRAIRRSRFTKKDLSDANVDTLFDAIDSNGDGQVSAEEFCDFMENKGIVGVTAVGTVPQERHTRLQPKLQDEKLQGEKQIVKGFLQTKGSSMIEWRPEVGSAGKVKGTQVGAERAGCQLAGAGLGGRPRGRSVDVTLPKQKKEAVLRPAGYARVFATEVAGSARGLAPHVITPQMALASSEERTKQQKGATYMQNKREKKMASAGMAAAIPAAGDTAGAQAGSLPRAGASRDSLQRAGGSFDDPSQMVRSGSHDVLRGSVTFTDEPMDDGMEDAVPLSMDPALQQDMIEYVADLKELLAAGELTQEEFTTWVLRKMDGYELEMKLSGFQGAEGLEGGAE